MTSHYVEQAGIVLRLIMSAGRTLTLKKGFSFSNAIHYLGHTIRPGTLEAAKKTTDATKGSIPPTNISEPRSFSDLWTVYQGVILNFSWTTAPLIAKVEKDEPKSFELAETELAVMGQLREKFMTPPTLGLPKKEGKLIIGTDAFEEQVGFVLQQKQNDCSSRSIG